MNRLLNVCQHPALARAAQQTLLETPTTSGITACLSAASSLVHRNWFGTAPSAPSASPGQDPQQRFSGEEASSSAQHSAVGSRPAAATPGAAAGPSTPSAAHPISDASTPNASIPGTSAVDGTSSSSSHDSSSGASVAAEGAVEDGYVDVQPGARAAPMLLQVVPTPGGPQRDKLLVRDFIQNSLYHPTLGYFNAPTPPVGSMGSPVNYWKIYCKDEFNILVKKKYQELETSFLTPAELFSPWYGACIARHMVEHRRHFLGAEGQPLHIVEVGGGNGTLARDILDWLRDNRPADYAMTSYTCLEISTSLAARQYDKVVRQGGHRGRFHLRRGSGLDPAAWGRSRPGEREWEHTFVLMMEVLDNLPHDRVFRRRASEPWQQGVVRVAPASASASASASPSMEAGPWEEAGEPLSDPLLARTLAAAYKAPSREAQLDERFNRVLDFILARDAQPASREEVMWLPTAAAAFLELLHDVRPNHSLIAADFDRLPDVRLPGRNAPLVAQKVGGRNIDHDTLLVPWGTADIFFPTDFDTLCDLYRSTAEHVWGPTGTAHAAAAPAAAPGAAPGAVAVSNVGDVNAEHFRQGAVIKRYREMFKTATICAFNPMVDDFVNARFFFGDSKNRYAPGQERPAQSKVRLPNAAAASAPGTGIRSHIPAAPASAVRQRLQPPGPPPPPGQGRGPGASEPVLGGRRQRQQQPGEQGSGGGIGGGGRGRGPAR